MADYDANATPNMNFSIPIQPNTITFLALACPWCGLLYMYTSIFLLFIAAYAGLVDKRTKSYFVFVKILSAIYLASTTFLLALTTFLWYIHAPWKLSIPNRKNEYTDEKNSLYPFFLFSIPNKNIHSTQFWKSLCPFRKISLSDFSNAELQ